MGGMVKIRVVTKTNITNQAKTCKNPKNSSDSNHKFYGFDTDWLKEITRSN